MSPTIRLRIFYNIFIILPQFAERRRKKRVMTFQMSIWLLLLILKHICYKNHWKLIKNRESTSCFNNFP